MNPRFSEALQSDIMQTVQLAVETLGTVNVPVLAEEVRLRHVAENVAFEDIQFECFRLAQWLDAPMEFDGAAAGLFRRAEAQI